MSQHMTRRSVLRLVGFATAGSLVAACSSPAPAAPTSVPAAPTTAPVAKPVATTTAPQPASAQPKTGGTLRIADMDLPRLDGHLIYTNGINISWIQIGRAHV